ncbi:MAG: GNAT family N-acetyltransferase [Nitratireductor sp.]|nr:GNAT family N-acetyltransferase [Nitratireductor sp.]
MIQYIEMQQREEKAHLLEQFFRLRKHVFCDSLGWVPPSPDGLENDEFDDRFNIVIVNVDEQTGMVDGGVRLMPTTGPTLLHKVWPDMLPDPDAFRSADIWEATRFCVGNLSNTTRKRNFVNRATLALSLSVLEFCSANGISHVVGVCEKKFFDMQRVYGTRAEIISSKIDENGVAISCGLWQTGRKARSQIAWAKPFLGGVEPVLLSRAA